MKTCEESYVFFSPCLPFSSAERRDLWEVCGTSHLAYTSVLFQSVTELHPLHEPTDLFNLSIHSGTIPETEGKGCKRNMQDLTRRRWRQDKALTDLWCLQIRTATAGWITGLVCVWVCYIFLEQEFPAAKFKSKSFWVGKGKWCFVCINVNVCIFLSWLLASWNASEQWLVDASISNKNSPPF